MLTISDWYCCLNPLERETLKLTVEGLVLTLNLGIPLDLWNAFWVLGIGAGEVRRSAFRNVYRLEIVNVEYGDPPIPTDVVRSTDYALVVEWGLYLVATAGLCLDGCQQSTFP